MLASYAARPFRATVAKQRDLRDARLVTKQKIEGEFGEIVELIRAAAAANSNVSYKARGDKPIDAMLVEKEALRGAGSQKERFARFVNISLASRGIDLSKRVHGWGGMGERARGPGESLWRGWRGMVKCKTHRDTIPYPACVPNPGGPGLGVQVF